MNGETPILVPGEPTRFVMASGDRDAYLLPPALPPLTFAAFAPALRQYATRPTPTRCNARRYVSGALAWDGRVACADGDDARVLVALRLAEVAILFCEVLAEIGGRGRGGALVRLVGVMMEAEAS